MLRSIMVLVAQMKNRWLFILIPLAACGTPQEQCTRAATRDMRVVDRLIVEVQENLARGYAFETETVYAPEWQDCTPRATDANPTPEPRLCFEEVPQTVRKAVALDLRAEAAKLQSLRQKRDLHAAASVGLLADCRARFPE